MNFINHSQCPKCAQLGKDRGSNNLGNYSDGSCYCFSCGYFSSKTRYRPPRIEFGSRKNIPKLPQDTTNILPIHSKEYLDRYKFTQQEIKKHFICWSPYWERLIFPIFDDTGLIAWQGRSFNPDKPKWYSQGDLKSILHIIGNKQAQYLILTEDIISSIVLSRVPEYCASPLFGSHLTINRLRRLWQILGYNIFILWLDKDKEKESLKYSYNARQLGFDCYSLVTNKDPKEYDEKTIKNLLTERLKCVTLN